MYKFRIATLDDVSSIVDLVESAYRGDASRQGWTTEADLLDGQRTDKDEVRRLITHTSSCILLCEDGGELIACVHLQNRSKYGYLGMFAVSPKNQAKGVGKLVLAEAENQVFHQWRCPLLRMAVISLRVDLIDWYLRRGYRANGDTMPFPYGDERYGIPKRDDLLLVVLDKRAPSIPGVTREDRLSEEGLLRLDRQLTRGGKISNFVLAQWIKRYGDSARNIIKKHNCYSDELVEFISKQETDSDK